METFLTSDLPYTCDQALGTSQVTFWRHMTPLDPLDKWALIVFALSPVMGWVWSRYIAKRKD